MTTKDKLIEATIDLVNEYGLTDIPTSKIAKKAAYSEATIYKHFDNKLELLIEAYLKIKSDLDKAIFMGTEGLSDTEKSRKIWFNYLDYFINNPKRLKYFLQFINSNYMNKLIYQRGEAKFETLIPYIQENIKKGIFRDLPINFYYAYIHVPIMEIARAAVNGEIELTDKLKEEAFRSCLRIIGTLKMAE